ncbi:DNA adenine methylase [Mesoplasma seiffertii]|uniref:DNA adenine methylase n=1 Tax=Mesoplasma seiffertii TaxID=28224 RepID=UPI00047E3E67|nr:Dam family site-specific DNA-(adenine-N6)-methyltransferase [Mesoplasma seiffertii]
MKPLVKWVGGKRRFIKDIDPYLKNYKRYIEPFAGSAAVFFHLNPQNAILNDLNKDLVNFYKNVRDNPIQLLKSIENLFEVKTDVESYYLLRDEYNSLKGNSLRKSAIFFYLNKVAFNGIYRVNSRGIFNVPVGKHKTYYIPTESEFLEASELLKNTKLYSISYESIMDKVNNKDLVYLDPPYFPDETSKFVGYTDPAFGKEQHYHMLTLCKNAFAKGATIIISNSRSKEFAMALYKTFDSSFITAIQIQTNRSINPNANNKNRFVEMLYVIKKEQ